MTITEAVLKRPINRGDKDPTPEGGPIWMIQTALNTQGANLVADGDYGRNTEAAVIAFKARNAYQATGNVGPLTAKLLDDLLAHKTPTPEMPLPSVLESAPWLSVARAITGVKEFPGGKDNPIILAWASYVVERFPNTKAGVGWYKHDETPWCGLTTAYCVAKAGFAPPAEPLYALNWLTSWADGVKLKEPALGAIMVKSRAGGGHVTIYEGEDANNFYCRGGNQSDMVNVSAIKKNDEVKGFMWPKGHPLPIGGRVATTFANAKLGKES